jgi:hypothetical protein
VHRNTIRVWSWIEAWPHANLFQLQTLRAPSRRAFPRRTAPARPSLSRPRSVYTTPLLYPYTTPTPRRRPNVQTHRHLHWHAAEKPERQAWCKNSLGSRGQPWITRIALSILILKWCLQVPRQQEIDGWQPKSQSSDCFKSASNCIK